ncbi:MAG: adenosylcobinamide-GDP ribazoletransferase [Blautia sp.]|nr:adenosylcobinamide-GDP ribazoletransferase [Blautia sp.]
MKVFWNNLKTAFAMFSRIPMPPADWNPENMQYMMCFFPLIGVPIGVLECLLFYLQERVCFSSIFAGAFVFLIPLLVTGGIHLDGFLDTSDALCSYREPLKRLEILKDSHVGAFAVICGCGYFILYFAGGCQLMEQGNTKTIELFALTFVMARCLSGLSVIVFPKAKADGTVAAFSGNASDVRSRNILIILLMVVYGVMLMVSVYGGLSMLLTSVVVFCYYRYKSMKYFGGTTGDLCGWFLCLCELWCLLVLGILSRMTSL